VAMAKRIKRLTKLRIDEVSVCDSGAGRGVEVVLMKRNVGFNDADELTIDGVPRWRRKKGGAVAKADSLERALQEIEETRRLRKSLAVEKEDTTMQTDIVTAMSKRLGEIRAVHPHISEGAAMLKLAESRNPDDQALWRQFKGEAVPAYTVGKAVNSEKAVRKMAKRCDQLMRSDPTIQSRESAIAKIATSRDPDDLRLWTRYRQAGQVADVAQLPHSSPEPVGKAVKDVALQNMIRAIGDAYPHLSAAQVRQWADAVMRGAPPEAMLHNTHTAHTR